MKIGLSSIGFGALAAPSFIRTIATHAERLNFSTVWAPEHVLLLDRYASRNLPLGRGQQRRDTLPGDRLRCHLHVSWRISSLA